MNYQSINNSNKSSQDSNFATFFKHYRLRAEFGTYSDFSDYLANKGFFYDPSIFSHWQKGTRKPTNRKLLLTIIEIFIERHAITNKKEADEFLASTGLGYLTDTESNFLFSSGQYSL